ncbi:MAG: hypothetical protein IJA12_00175 [Oscillospiraceae bacterium]|nr:hypothetical protein [Oscillospiraceae bacterium]
MSVLSDLINNENGFLVKLRCESKFDMDDYNEIKKLLISNSIEWKNSGCVPVEDVVAIMSVIEQLAGGSHFFNEDTSLKVEDACIEISGIVNDLI